MLAIAQKISEISKGWANYVWESEAVRVMAKQRAVECAQCPHSKKMMVMNFLPDDITEIEAMACELCECPLSAKLRSPKSICEIGKWQPVAL